jgi:hypothetical protein
MFFTPYTDLYRSSNKIHLTGGLCYTGDMFLNASAELGDVSDIASIVDLKDMIGAKLSVELSFFNSTVDPSLKGTITSDSLWAQISFAYIQLGLYTKSSFFGETGRQYRGKGRRKTLGLAI